MLSPQTKEEVMGQFLTGTRSVQSRIKTHGERVKMLRLMAEAQKALINRHWHFMDEETKKRAEAVKAGTYHGQVVK